jgi:hypothetical protein
LELRFGTSRALELPQNAPHAVNAAHPVEFMLYVSLTGSPFKSTHVLTARRNQCLAVAHAGSAEFAAVSGLCTRELLSKAMEHLATRKSVSDLLR